MLIRSLLCASFFYALIDAAATTSCETPPYPPSPSQVTEFISHVFDYVIIGGGTAGMVVAARLAQNENFTIGVIEAGYFHRDDPIINVPGLANQGAGNLSYDWEFSTVPQKYAKGRKISLTRGKMLGGSSGVNGMAWNRASSVEYDSWEMFSQGNDWNWDGILPFLKASESVSTTPKNPYPGISPDAVANASSHFLSFNGQNGPVIASYNSFYMDVVPTFVETMNKMGIPTNPEPDAGNGTGVQNTLLSIDRKEGVRSYSAMAYYCLRPPRKNLHILVGAQATGVEMTQDHLVFTASGVRFSIHAVSYVAKVKREVVLSAGALQTPHLLELSGIGDATILRAHGIPVLVDLPQVGENLQEHLYIMVQFLLKPGYTTFDILRNNASFAAEQLMLYDTNRTGFYADTDSTIGFLSMDSIVDESTKESLLEAFDRGTSQVEATSIEYLQYPIQRAWFEEGRVGHVEFIQWSKGVTSPAENGSYIMVLGGLSHPLSRGSVHIGDSDALQPPNIDPKFLSQEFDIMTLLGLLKFVQDASKISPLTDIIAAQTDPDPSLKTDAELIEWIRNTCGPGDHLVGTAAMAPREQGGVVDSSLKVYGINNLRVVDASIFPIHIAAHTQSTVYAIAEKVASLMMA